MKHHEDQQPPVVLARLDELSEVASRGFTVDNAGEPMEGFLVRRGEAVYAYINSCPHTGAPLDWMPDQFLDRDGDFIQCAMHGALFEIDSGRCVHGPCVNRKLQRVSVELVGRDIILSG